MWIFLLNTGAQFLIILHTYITSFWIAITNKSLILFYFFTDKVIALYPYKAQNDDELSFDKDDIISVLGRDEPEWWRGELNGLTGLFPSNYVGPFVTSGKKVNGN